MAATYNASQLDTVLLYFARSLFRDVAELDGTTVTVPLLQDEEYLGYITRFGAREGLARLAETLAATFAQKVQSVSQPGGEQVVWPRRSDFYLKLAENIRAYGVEGGGGAGGSSLRAGQPLLPTPFNDERLALS